MGAAAAWEAPTATFLHCFLELGPRDAFRQLEASVRSAIPRGWLTGSAGRCGQVDAFLAQA